MTQAQPDREPAVEQQVKGALAEKLGRPAHTIGMDDDLLADLGLDSLAIAELSASVEDAAGVRLRGIDLLDVVTVGDLVRLVENTLNQATAE